MLPARSLSALMITATVVSAFPAPDPLDDAGNGEAHVLKRDAPLSERDSELADLHGVNTTEMYRHSIVKREDGDHVTLWVHRSFEEHDEDFDGDFDEALGLDTGNENDKERRRVKAVGPGWYKGKDGCSDCCSKSSFKRLTSKRSPYTGGANQIIAWGKKNKGQFRLKEWWDDEWKDLVIAGTNKGANMRFSAKKWGDWATWIGSRDVMDLVRDARNRFQKKYSGKWRVAAEGRMGCKAMDHGQRDGGVAPVWGPGSSTTFWKIAHTKKKV